MLSILVVNWNTKEKLQACLTSILLYAPTEDHEIIVVDNDSSDGSAELVSNLFPSVKLIKPGWNTGYAKGNNIAFENAKGDYLLTLNPDTEFTDDAIMQSLNHLRDKPQIGALAIRLTDLQGHTQRSVRGFPTPVGVLGQVAGLDKLFPRTALGSYSLPSFDYSFPQLAPQPMGTFLLFRKQALVAAGDPAKPFDERFPIFFNEVDLLKRLLDLGWACWYEPSLGVLHHHGSSTKQVKKAMVWESHNSLGRYWDKHLRGPSRLMLPLYKAALFMAAFLRAKGYDAGYRAQRNNL